ncbi:MAG: TonB-dependent receptor plug domain-containing protein, partial [Nitrospirota bacterium]|nr:TonB-dependent receptor plug domain-containing protein [Nitrospirota bacterium]
MHILAFLFHFISAVRAILPFLFCSSLIVFLVFPSTAETSEEKPLETLLAMSLEELMKVEVISASKRPQKIVDAPSPIYVFTAEDIKRTGARTILELVKFIPGFYVYPRIDQPFVIATRGLRSTSNDKILFLLDGIPLNGISKGGAFNADKFPGLDMVKRVEIIPGPGSTMWGSDASLGIISIITKDGADVDGNIVNVNVSTEDDLRQYNLLSGKTFSDGEYMFSATYAENDGFGDKSHGYQNYVHDFGTVPWNDQQANFNWIYPSYEIYGKLRYKDFTFKALFSEKSVYAFWTTQQSTDYPDKIDQKSIHTSRNIHLELSHHGKLSDKMTLDTKITAKQIDYQRDKLVERGIHHGSDFICDPTDPTDVCKVPENRTEFFPEQGVGLEFIYNWDINKKNKLL